MFVGSVGVVGSGTTEIAPRVWIEFAVRTRYKSVLTWIEQSL